MEGQVCSLLRNLIGCCSVVSQPDNRHELEDDLRYGCSDLLSGTKPQSPNYVNQTVTSSPPQITGRRSPTPQVVPQQQQQQQQNKPILQVVRQVWGRTAAASGDSLHRGGGMCTNNNSRTRTPSTGYLSDRILRLSKPKRVTQDQTNSCNNRFTSAVPSITKHNKDDAGNSQTRSTIELETGKPQDSWVSFSKRLERGRLKVKMGSEEIRIRRSLSKKLLPAEEKSRPRLVSFNETNRGHHYSDHSICPIQTIQRLSRPVVVHATCRQESEPQHATPLLRTTTTRSNRTWRRKPTDCRKYTGIPSYCEKRSLALNGKVKSNANNTTGRQHDRNDNTTAIQPSDPSLKSQAYSPKTPYYVKGIITHLTTSTSTTSSTTTTSTSTSSTTTTTTSMSPPLFYSRRGYSSSHGSFLSRLPSQRLEPTSVVGCQRSSVRMYKIKKPVRMKPDPKSKSRRPYEIRNGSGVVVVTMFSPSCSCSPSSSPHPICESGTMETWNRVKERGFLCNSNETGQIEKSDAVSTTTTTTFSGLPKGGVSPKSVSLLTKSKGSVFTTTTSSTSHLFPTWSGKLCTDLLPSRDDKNSHTGDSSSEPGPMEIIRIGSSARRLLPFLYFLTPLQRSWYSYYIHRDDGSSNRSSSSSLNWDGLLAWVVPPPPPPQSVYKIPTSLYKIIMKDSPKVSPLPFEKGGAAETCKGSRGRNILLPQVNNNNTLNIISSSSWCGNGGDAAVVARRTANDRIKTTNDRIKQVFLGSVNGKPRRRRRRRQQQQQQDVNSGCCTWYETPRFEVMKVRREVHVLREFCNRLEVDVERARKSVENRKASSVESDLLQWRTEQRKGAKQWGKEREAQQRHDERIAWHETLVWQKCYRAIAEKREQNKWKTEYEESKLQAELEARVDRQNQLAYKKYLEDRREHWFSPPREDIGSGGTTTTSSTTSSTTRSLPSICVLSELRQLNGWVANNSQSTTLVHETMRSEKIRLMCKAMELRKDLMSVRW